MDLRLLCRAPRMCMAACGDVLDFFDFSKELSVLVGRWEDLCDVLFDFFIFDTVIHDVI